MVGVKPSGFDDIFLENVILGDKDGAEPRREALAPVITASEGELEPPCRILVGVGAEPAGFGDEVIESVWFGDDKVAPAIFARIVSGAVSWRSDDSC